jgi:hypothetical protein
VFAGSQRDADEVLTDMPLFPNPDGSEAVDTIAEVAAADAVR